MLSYSGDFVLCRCRCRKAGIPRIWRRSGRWQSPKNALVSLRTFANIRRTVGCRGPAVLL